jgi:glycosyltransferase involved in cell wall biosynthesis
MNVKEKHFPKVSILIPVYNRIAYIDECIQSAVDQSYQDFEIIIVDNASTDGTWEVCQRFASEYSNIKIFKNEFNIGPVENWRKCINEAEGMLGKLLFSDDLIHTDFLRESVHCLDDSSVGFVFSSVNIGVSPNECATHYGFKKESCKFSSKEFLVSTLLGHGALPVSPGAALFRLADLRRFLVSEVESPSYNDFASHGAGPDMLIFLFAANEYSCVAYVNKAMAFFRVHSESISMKGANTIMHQRYFQAKLWFAKEVYGNPVVLKRLLCQAWLDQLISTKRLMKIDSVQKMYFFEPIGIGIWETVMVAGVELVIRVWASIKFRFLRFV